MDMYEREISIEGWMFLGMFRDLKKARYDSEAAMKIISAVFNKHLGYPFERSSTPCYQHPEEEHLKEYVEGIIIDRHTEEEIPVWYKIIKRNPTDPQKIFTSFCTALRNPADVMRRDIGIDYEILRPNIELWIKKKEEELTVQHTTISDTKTHKLKRTKINSISDFLVIEDPESIINKLRQLPSNLPPKMYGAVITVMINEGIMRQIVDGERSAIYRALCQLYTDGRYIGRRQSVTKYICKDPLSDLDIASAKNYLR